MMHFGTRGDARKPQPRLCACGGECRGLGLRLQSRGLNDSNGVFGILYYTILKRKRQ